MLRVSHSTGVPDPSQDLATLSSIVRDAIDMFAKTCFKGDVRDEAIQAAQTVTMNYLGGMSKEEKPFIGLAAVAVGCYILRYIVEYSVGYRVGTSPDDESLSRAVDYIYRTQHLRGAPVIDHKPEDQQSTLLVFSRVLQDYHLHFGDKKYRECLTGYMLRLDEMMNDKVGGIDLYIDHKSCKGCPSGFGSIVDYDMDVGLHKCVCGRYLVHLFDAQDMSCFESLIDGYDPIDIYMTGQL